MAGRPCDVAIAHTNNAMALIKWYLVQSYSSESSDAHYAIDHNSYIITLVLSSQYYISTQ